MRKAIIMTLAVLMVLSCATVAAAQAPSIYINGNALVSPNPAVIENGRTLVPLRAIFESLNQQVNWNGNDQSITSGSIWLQINNKTAKVGDKNIALDVPAKLINSRTYVPLRFVAESLGKDVKWDGAKNRIDIFDKKPAAAEQASQPAKPPAAENPSMDFKLTDLYYDEEGNLMAKGTFLNTGNVYITKILKVRVKVFLANDAGDSEEVADSVFTDMPVNISPGQSDEYTFIFTDVPVYTDATKWWSDEVDWEFEYLSGN